MTDEQRNAIDELLGQMADLKHAIECIPNDDIASTMDALAGELLEEYDDMQDDDDASDQALEAAELLQKVADNLNEAAQELNALKLDQLQGKVDDIIKTLTDARNGTF